MQAARFARPDLYTLVRAAQQIAGDQFAIKLAKTACEYPFDPELASPEDLVTFGIDQVRLPERDSGGCEILFAGPAVALAKLPTESQTVVRRSNQMADALESVYSMQLAT